MGLPTGFVREQPEVSLGKETLGLPESQKQCLVKNVALPAEFVSQGGAPQQQRGAGCWYAKDWAPSDLCFKAKAPSNPLP